MVSLGQLTSLGLGADAVRRRAANGRLTRIHRVVYAVGNSRLKRLVGLDALPPDGFEVACLPLAIAGASAVPARVVAMLPRAECVRRTD